MAFPSVTTSQQFTVVVILSPRSRGRGWGPWEGAMQKRPSLWSALPENKRKRSLDISGNDRSVSSWTLRLKPGLSVCKQGSLQTPSERPRKRHPHPAIPASETALAAGPFLGGRCLLVGALCTHLTSRGHLRSGRTPSRVSSRALSRAWANVHLSDHGSKHTFLLRLDFISQNSLGLNSSMSLSFSCSFISWDCNQYLQYE